MAQAARDLEAAESVLRRWMRELTVASAAAFPENGQMLAYLAEIEALKKEVARLRVERDILKKAADSAKTRFASSVTPTGYGTRNDFALAICTVPSAVAPRPAARSASGSDASIAVFEALSNSLCMAINDGPRTFQGPA